MTAATVSRSRSPETTSFPVVTSALPADPNLTFSIYAEGLLDDLILRLIRPFQRELSRQRSASLLWVVRYSRRGEHLKVRLHVEGTRLDRVRRGFLERAEGYLDGLGTLPLPEKRSHLSDVPAIDPEDALDGTADDRSLLPTRYRRGFVNLGGEPFLSMDAYAGLMARSLSAGLGAWLEEIEGIEDARILWRPRQAWRQKTLLKTLLVGLHAGEGISFEGLKAYCEFHRDCLLEFYLPNAEIECRTRELFAESAAKSPLGSLRAFSASEALRREDGRGAVGAWRRAVRDLRDYLAPFDGNPDFLTHPLAAHVAWPPLFKVFHGLANQIGVPPLKEAYVHHLTARILEQDTEARGAEGDVP